MDPGLAVTDNSSRICVDCHSVTPGGGAGMNASHFVSNVAGAHTTRTGGGWGVAGTDSKYGPRNNGAYIKTTAWPSGAYSKYGRFNGGSDNASLIATTPNDNTGTGVLATFATISTAGEMICESCHSLIKNVAGGNNLVAPMTSATYQTDGLPGVTQDTTGWSNSQEATMCVGCHGFMYSAYQGTPLSSTTAGAGSHFADARNAIDGGSTKKDVNHFKSVDGKPYHQNHHVMYQDAISLALTQAGLTWSPVLTLDALSVRGTMSTIGFAATASQVGQVPQRLAWDSDGGKTKPSTDGNFNCLHCHSTPHYGDDSTAASILRDTNAGGTGSVTLISRLGDGTRTWMGFNDVNYCQDCHKIRGQAQ